MSVFAELYKGRLGRYRWRVKNTKNAKNMANGSQGYKNRSDAVHGMCEVLGLSRTQEKTSDGHAVTVYHRGNQIFPVVDLTKEDALNRYYGT